MAKEQKNKNIGKLATKIMAIILAVMMVLSIAARKIIHANVLSDVEDSYTFVLLYCSKIMKKEVIYV